MTNLQLGDAIIWKAFIIKVDRMERARSGIGLPLSKGTHRCLRNAAPQLDGDNVHGQECDQRADQLHRLVTLGCFLSLRQRRSRGSLSCKQYQDTQQQETQERPHDDLDRHHIRRPSSDHDCKQDHQERLEFAVRHQIGVQGNVRSWVQLSANLECERSSKLQQGHMPGQDTLQGGGAPERRHGQEDHEQDHKLMCDHIQDGTGAEPVTAAKLLEHEIVVSGGGDAEKTRGKVLDDR